MVGKCKPDVPEANDSKLEFPEVAKGVGEPMGEFGDGTGPLCCTGKQEGYGAPLNAQGHSYV